MSPLAFRIVMTVCVCGVVGLMAWDQRRLGSMRPWKWGIAGALVAVLAGNVWL